MSVTSGNALSDIQVKFTPSGLEFSPPAELELYLFGKLDDDMRQMIQNAYHITGDGNVTKIETDVNSFGGLIWRVSIKVPGFSRYTIDP